MNALEISITEIFFFYSTSMIKENITTYFDTVGELESSLEMK